MNVPKKGLVDRRSMGLSRPAKATRQLSRVGPRNRNTGMFIRGRQHGRGFPPSQV